LIEKREKNMSLVYTPAMEEIYERTIRSENRSASGKKVNWDYVDADCWLDGVVEMFDSQDAYYEAFNAIADDYNK
jgi:hypothetical protein